MQRKCIQLPMITIQINLNPNFSSWNVLTSHRSYSSSTPIISPQSNKSEPLLSEIQFDRQFSISWIFLAQTKHYAALIFKTPLLCISDTCLKILTLMSYSIDWFYSSLLCYCIPGSCNRLTGLWQLRGFSLETKVTLPESNWWKIPHPTWCLQLITTSATTSVVPLKRIKVKSMTISFLSLLICRHLCSVSL